MIDQVLGAVAGGIAAYAIFVERKAVGLTRIELGFSDLPQPFDGFTILQLSDMHVSHWWGVERRMEKLVRGLDPDVLALTGDIAVGHRGAILIREFLGRFMPGKETYAVFGNSEHKGEYGRKRREDLDWPGLKVLTNEHVVIERNGERLVLAGVDDPFSTHDDLGKALSGAPEGAFKVLLAHAPSVAGEAADAGVRLIVSGHTHGGQIRFPLVGAIYPHLHKYRRLVMGLFEGERLSRILGKDAGEMRVYVSRGVGISNLPARLLCPPEITLITLRRT